MKSILRYCTALLLSAALLLCLCSCSVRGNKPVPATEPTTSNTVRVVFPEGSTVAQIGTLLEQNGVCSLKDFLAAVNDKTNLTLIPAQISNSDERAFVLEGYVFPDTYDFYRGESAQRALERFLSNARSKITDDMRTRAQQMGYTMDEIMIIASIVQEEAGDPNEMPKVASVIHNRLANADFPKLQCDVATFYLRDYVKPYVTENYDRYIDLYNTYNCLGLPAGPITNPGIDAVTAVLYPADTDYYYFVTDKEMNYYYAETWNEHLRNCDIAGL